MIQFKLIAYAAIAAALFFAGWQVNGWRWEAKLADAKQKAESARLTLADKNATLIQEASKHEQKVITKTRIVYKQIASIHGDARCIDDGELRFIAHWNEITRQTSQPDGAAPTP